MTTPPPAAPALGEMSRVVLRGAATEAAGRGDARVRPEHVLLAQLAIPEAVGNRLLRRQGVSPEDVARDLAAELDAISRGTGAAAPPLPLAPETEAVLDAAQQAAAGAKAEYVGTEFLLLGLAARPGDPAGRVLAHHGLTYEALRAAIADRQ